MLKAPSSVFLLASALVHDAANAVPLERHRHAVFIAKRLGFSFAALACVPFFLAFRGAPTGSETLLLACSFAPLLGAMVTARTGRLVAAHAIVMLGLAGLGLTLWLGLGCGAACTMTWLLAAHIEARSAADRGLSVLAAGLTLVVLLAILTMPEAGLAPSQSAATSVAAAGLALVYCWVVYAEWWGANKQTPVTDEELSTWRTVSETIDDVVIAVDSTGLVERIRMDADARLGVPSRVLLGRGFLDRIHLTDQPVFLKLCAEAGRDDATAIATVRLRTDAHPADRRVEIRARRISSSDGADAKTPARLVAILRNVKAELVQNLEAETARRSIDDAAQSKHHFLANMSHELRTPLNAIIGFSEMLASHTLRPADPGKQREYARIINQSGQHLLSVVNSILDMSKIQSGTFAIVPEPFDLIPLVELCCDMVMLKVREGRLQLVRDYPKHLETMVGDKRACQQILINLLSNAVKFTPECGTVTISVRPEGTSLALIVRDTGIGIAADDLARLGDPFFQAVPSLSRPFEGTGLGLSVVRGLVGLHGGTIAIESEPGHGTSVKVRLPLDSSATAHASGSATIETLNRHQIHEAAPSLPEPRIMQVA